MNTQIATKEPAFQMVCHLVDDAVCTATAAASAGDAHWTAVAGAADTLALLRTVILLARSFRASIRLDTSHLRRRDQRREAAPIEIHFGRAPCNALIGGLLESVERQLTNSAGVDAPAFLLRVELPRNGEPIVVRVGRIEAERGERQ